MATKSTTDKPSKRGRPPKNTNAKADKTKTKTEEVSIDENKQSDNSDVEVEQAETPAISNEEKEKRAEKYTLSEDNPIDSSTDPLLNSEVQYKKYAEVRMKDGDPDDIEIPEHKLENANVFDMDMLEKMRTPQDENKEKEEERGKPKKEKKEKRETSEDFYDKPEYDGDNDLADFETIESETAGGGDFNEFKSAAPSAEGTERLVNIIILAYKQLLMMTGQAMKYDDRKLKKMAAKGKFDFGILDLPIELSAMDGSGGIQRITVKDYIDAYNDNIDTILVLDENVENEVRKNLNIILAEQGYEMSPAKSLATIALMEVFKIGIPLFIMSRQQKATLIDVTEQYRKTKAK